MKQYIFFGCQTEVFNMKRNQCTFQ